MKKWSEVLKIQSGRNQKDVISPDGRYPIYGSAGKVMGYASDYLSEAGSIIIGRKGTINNPMLIPERFWNVDTAFALHSGKSLDNRFLFYFCLGFDFTEMDRGSGRPSLVKSYLKQIQIPLPPLPNQRAIVAHLDAAFALIDRARANLERNVASARELFQAKLNEVFSWRGDGWEEKPLGDVCENLDRQRKPITKSKRTPGPIPYYGASGIVDYVEGYLFDEELLLVSEDGANLLARTYPIAFSISGKSWVNNHAHVLKFQDSNNQQFVEYYLNSIKLNDFISGMAQPKLNQKKLNSIPIPYPSLTVQAETVELVDRLNAELDELINHYQTQLQHLTDLKQSLLQKAFRGELIAE